jgi:N-sulfoglucosamine sulfohydrolase
VTTACPLPYAKTNCYLASNITPFILRWPGHIESGAVDQKNFVSTIDVAPTFLSAAGVENLEGANGLSLASSDEGRRTSRPQPGIHLP